MLIEPPTKIILLGDILDIWDPKDQDRNNVIKDAVEPFSILHDIDCEKIYVTGNHDEDIEEIEKKIKSFEWKKSHNLFSPEDIILKKKKYLEVMMSMVCIIPSCTGINMIRNRSHLN